MFNDGYQVRISFCSFEGLKNNFMLAMSGIYQDGYIRLEKDYPSKKPVKVIITFLEEVEAPEEKTLSFSDFSFAESRKALESYKGSFSDAVIEERRTGL